jgi:hypothetical protein
MSNRIRYSPARHSLTKVKAAELKVGDRILDQNGRGQVFVETVSRIRRYPDVAFGALAHPVPQVEVEVVGGWSSGTYEPDRLVEVVLGGEDERPYPHAAIDVERLRGY